MLEPGLVEHIALQLPTGDMTFDEAKRTLETFASEVMPRAPDDFGRPVTRRPEGELVTARRGFFWVGRRAARRSSRARPCAARCTCSGSRPRR